MLKRSRPATGASGVLSSARCPSRTTLIRALRRLPAKTRDDPAFPLLEKLRAWMSAPTCLWPTGLDTIGLRVTETMRKGKPLDAETKLLLHLLATPLPPEVCAVIARHEADLRTNAGRHLIRAKHKHAILQRERQHCAALAAGWKQITAIFDVTKYQDRDGRIRQRFMQDQDLRMDLRLDWTCEHSRFYAVFNTFCHQWNLDGMQGNTPVLLKSIAHLTPFGTCLLIPTYWSLDPRRDFHWDGIRILHHTRSLSKQGPKLSSNQFERRKIAAHARRLMAQAISMGLKGSRRDDWVMRKLNWDVRTDPRALRRLLKETP